MQMYEFSHKFNLERVVVVCSAHEIESTQWSAYHFSSTKTVPAAAVSGKTILGTFTCFSVIDQLYTLTDLCLPIAICRQKAIILSQLNLSFYCPTLDCYFFHTWVLLLCLREKNHFHFCEKMKCFLNTFLWQSITLLAFLYWIFYCI